MRCAIHLAHIEGTEDANKILAEKTLKGRYFRVIKEQWVRRMLRGGLH
jgi:hypothetical protein